MFDELKSSKNSEILLDEIDLIDVKTSNIMDLNINS